MGSTETEEPPPVATPRKSKSTARATPAPAGICDNRDNATGNSVKDSLVFSNTQSCSTSPANPSLLSSDYTKSANSARQTSNLTNGSMSKVHSNLPSTTITPTSTSTLFSITTTTTTVSTSTVPTFTTVSTTSLSPDSCVSASSFITGGGPGLVAAVAGRIFSAPACPGGTSYSRVDAVPNTTPGPTSSLTISSILTSAGSCSYTTATASASASSSYSALAAAACVETSNSAAISNGDESGGCDTKNIRRISSLDDLNCVSSERCGVDARCKQEWHAEQNVENVEQKTNKEFKRDGALCDDVSCSPHSIDLSLWNVAADVGKYKINNSEGSHLEPTADVVDGKECRTFDDSYNAYSYSNGSINASFEFKEYYELGNIDLTSESAACDETSDVVVSDNREYGVVNKNIKNISSTTIAFSEATSSESGRSYSQDSKPKEDFISKTLKNGDNESHFERCRRIFDFGEGFQKKTISGKTVSDRSEVNGFIVKQPVINPRNNNDVSKTNSINIVSIELEPSKTTITSRLLVSPHNSETTGDFVQSPSQLLPRISDFNTARVLNQSSSDYQSIGKANFASQMPSDCLRPSATKSKRSGITTVSIKAECHEEQPTFRNRQPSDSNLSSPSKVRQCLKHSTNGKADHTPNHFQLTSRSSNYAHRRDSSPQCNGETKISNNSLKEMVSNCEYLASVNSSKSTRSSEYFQSLSSTRTSKAENSHDDHETYRELEDDYSRMDSVVEVTTTEDAEDQRNFINGYGLNESSDLNTSQNSEGVNSSGYSTLDDCKVQNTSNTSEEHEPESDSPSFGEEVCRSKKNPKFENYRSPRGRRSKRGVLSSKPVHVNNSTNDHEFVNIGEICVSKSRSSHKVLYPRTHYVSDSKSGSNGIETKNGHDSDAFSRLSSRASNSGVTFSNDCFRRSSENSGIRTSHLYSRTTLPCVLEEPCTSTSSHDPGGQTSFSDLPHCGNGDLRRLDTRRPHPQANEKTRPSVPSKSLHFYPSPSGCQSTGDWGSAPLVRISALGHLHEESPGCCVLSACSSVIYSAESFDGPNCCSWNRQKSTMSPGEHTLDPDVSNGEDITTRLGIFARPCTCSESLSRSLTPPPILAYPSEGLRVMTGGPSQGGVQEVDDLIHLTGPLTEDAVLKTLSARFCSHSYFTNVGPTLVSLNPYTAVGNDLTLASTRGEPQAPHLLRVVHEAVRQQCETSYPQAIILSGASGSGKTYTSMLLLRQLFEVAGGGPETDAFKHLSAAFTVLRSLGLAKTATNSESSRIGHFIEVQVTDGALYRTKIHCYFLDQTRVVRPLPHEKNYHIFYQMLAGLTPEEREKLHLEGHSVRTLRYLNQGDIRVNEAQDARRFEEWKACLSVLGIPFLDVIRVLTAVMLLGNVTFIESQGLEVDIEGGSHELKSVAALLGVSPGPLCRGLVTRTHNVRGQVVKSMCDANMSNMTRDALAKALYCRTVATIVRRANSLKRLGSPSGTLSSDSNESEHHHGGDAASQHASTVGTGGSKASKSMSVLNSAVKHATDRFIGILDMFGFEDPKPAHLEHLCINLCAETMQHFYNTHMFKSSFESCREEGISSIVEVDYVDNVPCIDLISSLRTGLLSMLGVECSVRGTPESYVQKVKVQHKGCSRLFEPKGDASRTFGIHHYAGRVAYEASDFLDTNRDIIPDDLVCVFHKHTCNFGFATHLFGSEMKAVFSQDPAPRGVSFRISPTSHTDLKNGDEPVSTLTQDFHTRLDNLLRTVVHAKPHFIRCLRANSSETPGLFDRATVIKQIRALQILETVNLMAGGYPHRMRFRTFVVRFRLIVPTKKLKRTDEKTIEDCKTIFETFLRSVDDTNKVCMSPVTWAIGKRHIFYSEGARQQLEMLRIETRHRSSTLIQAVWKGYHIRRRWPTLRRNLELRQRSRAVRPRPQPIACTPPPDVLERCDHKTIQQTCNLFGLDLERPPPVPPSRSYTIAGNQKLGYPQTRLMKMGYPEDGSGDIVLVKGESVVVAGASHRRGHVRVEHQGHSIHVPYQYLESAQPPVNI